LTVSPFLLFFFLCIVLSPAEIEFDEEEEGEEEDEEGIK
jgi:hypothetical protein